MTFANDPPEVTVVDRGGSKTSEKKENSCLVDFLILDLGFI
jgi:hypothetical protein